ncbi:putative clathrin assembly protein At1g33340 [Aristolochia californica]|uniref:putative clathrin assembly protein At1g33340 n=1 Tax=Aristolochia californica TaxID=171875 RepID=UPI0035E175E2
MVICWLINSMEVHVVNNAVHLETAKDIWDTCAKLYSKNEVLHGINYSSSSIVATTIASVNPSPDAPAVPSPVELSDPPENGNFVILIAKEDESRTRVAVVAMVVGVGTMIRQALGSFKDHAAIGKAIISGQDVFSDMEIAVVRATAHDYSPTDEKYVHEILFLVSNSPGSTPFLARRITRRLHRTKDPVVALKTLLLVHRLMRGGDRSFEQQLRNARISGDLSISNLHSFLRCPSDAFISFLLSYVRFLEDRIGWVINQAGKLEPFLPQGFYEEKSVETVFCRLPRCQTFLDRIMDCLPIEICHAQGLVQAALCNILREGFQVYASFCEGVTTLVDSFFDFKKSARASALAIFRRASSQTHRLSDFFEDCKSSTMTASNLDFPAVRVITPACVTTMEEFLTSSQAFGNGFLSSILDPPPPTSCKLPVSDDVSRSGILPSFDTVFASPKLETKICTVWVKFDEEEAKKTCSVSVEAPDDEDEARDDWSTSLQIEEATPYRYYNPFLSSPRTKTGNFFRG